MLLLDYGATRNNTQKYMTCKWDSFQPMQSPYMCIVSHYILHVKVSV